MTSNGWNKVILGEVSYYGNEKVASTEITQDNYISTENMLSNKSGVDIASTLPKTKNVSKYKKGDILLSNIRPYFKKIWLASKSGGCSNDVLVIKNKDSSILDKAYLYYSLLQDNFFDYVTATSKGTKMPRGDKTAIMNYGIFLPPLHEQKIIANFFSTLDEKIETNIKINEKLEDMAQALFKHWFVDFEFPNENGNPYKSSGGEMVMSELGMIPKSWEMKSLGDITALIIDHRGKTPKKLGGDWSQIGYTAISAKNIKNNRIVRSDDFKYLDENLYKKWMKDTLDEGDILMTSEAPLGETLYLAEKEEYVLSQRLYGIRANPKIIFPSLLFMSINSTSVKENINNRATGTTVTGIRQSELRKVPIIIPPMKIQEQLNKTINACLKKVYYNEKENRKLQLIRDTLLPKIMTGEINVPIDDEVSLKS